LKRIDEFEMWEFCVKLVNWDYLYAVWKSVGLGRLLEEDELEELGLEADLKRP